MRVGIAGVSCAERITAAIWFDMWFMSLWYIFPLESIYMHLKLHGYSSI